MLDSQFPIKLIDDKVYQLEDHLQGFDINGLNQTISALEPAELHLEYLLPDWIKNQYPQHNFKFNAELVIKNNHFNEAIRYKDLAKDLQFDNFLSCFNRSYHNGRRWLVESLYLRGLFNVDYCSKGFVIPQEKFNVETHNFKRQITIHGGTVNAIDVGANLACLSPLISQSFVTLVAETVPESYAIFLTEKFLFPILNKRLWMAYAQPGYHKFLKETLGFRLYDDFFDYSFDSILDPHLRLSTLLDAIEPYSKLSKRAWGSIYKSLESTIEYNHQWATTGQFVNQLKELNEVTKSVSIAEQA